MKTIVLAGLTAVAVLPLAACGSSGNDGDTVKIGVIVSESGDGASIGADEAKGYDAALKSLNDAGGIAGKKVEFIKVDDKSQDATAVLKVRELVNEEGVVAVLGPGGASPASAAASVADSLQVPLIAFPSNKGETWEGKNVSSWAFGVAASGESIGEGCLAKYLDWAEANGSTPASIAIGAETDGAPPQYASGVTTAAEDAGVDVLTRQDWPADVVDLTPQMTNVRSADPDTLVVSAYLESDVQATRALEQLDMPSDNVLQCSSIVLSDYIDSVGKAATGMKFMALGADDPAKVPADFPLADEIKDFRTAYQNVFPGEEPSRFAAGSYQTAMMLRDAIKDAGSTDPDAVRDALEAFDGYEGAYSIISYTPDRHRPSAEDYQDSSLLFEYTGTGFENVSADAK